MRANKTCGNLALYSVLVLQLYALFAHAKYYGKAYPEKVGTDEYNKDVWIRAPPTDKIIHKLFFPEQTGGKYVEIGAFDGIADSNTLFF